MKKLILAGLIGLTGLCNVHAQFTVTVTPGYQFSPNETPQTATLNALGTPTVSISGNPSLSNSVTAISMTSTDIFLVASYGTNTAAPNGSATPVVATASIRILFSTPVPWKFYTNANSGFGGGTVTNYYASMVTNGNYTLDSSPVRYTNYNARDLLEINWAAGVGNGQSGLTTWLYYTNFSQTNFAIIGGVGNQAPSSSGSNYIYGTSTLPLNPNDIFGIYSANGGGTITIYQTELYGF